MVLNFFKKFKTVIGDYSIRFKVKTVVCDYGLKIFKTVVTNHDFNFKPKIVFGDYGFNFLQKI